MPSEKNREGVEIDVPMLYLKIISDLTSRLMVDLEKNELYYDYYTPETIETKVSDLQQVNVELNTTMGTLLMESANGNATITSLEDTIGTLFFEVAALEGVTE
ncbi:hypothetical protein PVOR_29109 [Paenibacillus vortex V453]|uniref:Uncharacterized protein n=1 Tax=Paenibacillus vortex V453 TaxID=715225 RepID=A0A2R9SMT1_9BACL|nr:hypothetical protein [Paenibacillus vortex]EFU38670.1 hypothetical protein PVOR_29109 [Paenibacillus vortex V453]